MRNTIIILDGIDTQINGRASKIMQKLMWIPYVLKKSFFFFLCILYARKWRVEGSRGLFPCLASVTSKTQLFCFCSWVLLWGLQQILNNKFRIMFWWHAVYSPDQGYRLGFNWETTLWAWTWKTWSFQLTQADGRVAAHFLLFLPSFSFSFF